MSPAADCTSQQSDHLNDHPESRTPETLAVHLYHHPANEMDVNAVTFVFRVGTHTLTVKAHNGSEGDGAAVIPTTPFRSGSEEFLSVIATRHTLLAAVQDKLAAAAPQLLHLFEDLRS